MLTVKELKAFIENWPETDRYGDPCEVWIETGRGLSSPCIEIMQLNQTDIILSPKQYE